MLERQERIELLVLQEVVDEIPTPRTRSPPESESGTDRKSRRKHRGSHHEKSKTRSRSSSPQKVRKSGKKSSKDGMTDEPRESLRQAATQENRQKSFMRRYSMRRRISGDISSLGRLLPGSAGSRHIPFCRHVSSVRLTSSKTPL